MVAIIVFIMMIFDFIIGSPLPANNEVFTRFSIFHDCMHRIPLKNVRESCRNAEGCLDDLFDRVGDYLNAKAEIKAKLEVKHELDHFKQDCNNIFDMANRELFCQLNGIKVCLNKTHTIYTKEPLCKKLFLLRDCLGPFELDCWNRIFAAILRTITLGIWESNGCSNSNSATEAINSSKKKTTSSINGIPFNNTLVSTTNKPYTTTTSTPPPIAQHGIFNMKSRSLNLVKDDDVSVLNDDDNIDKVDRSFNETVMNHSKINCTSFECNDTSLNQSDFNYISPARDFIDFPDFTDETILTNNNISNVSNKGINSKISNFVFILSLLIYIVYI